MNLGPMGKCFFLIHLFFLIKLIHWVILDLGDLMPLKFKNNLKVFDRWYYYKSCSGTPIKGSGKVTKVTSKSVYVKFTKGTVRYDMEHATAFLQKLTKKNVQQFALR